MPPAQLAQAIALAGTGFVVTLCIAHTQHFGSGHPFGIRQVGGLHHHDTAQRHGVEHTQRAACGTDQRGLPERKTGPQAQHQQTWQHKDDGRQRACGRSLGLHHVVFEDVGILETVQQGHGDHGSGNGRSKSESDFEAQIHVGRREGQCDQRPQQYATQGELSQGLVGIHKCCGVHGPGACSGHQVLGNGDSSHR